MTVFDFASFFSALDGARRERALGWYDLAEEMWEQSADLNAKLMDHPLCGGAVSRLGDRGETSCQYALFMLRWLGRAPEEFLTDPSAATLPMAGPDARLRWNLARLHAALNDERTARGLTWADLGRELDCSPARLTNLKSARMADLELTMRVTHWLGRVSTDFIEATTSQGEECAG